MEQQRTHELPRTAVADQGRTAPIPVGAAPPPFDLPAVGARAMPPPIFVADRGPIGAAGWSPVAAGALPAGAAPAARRARRWPVALGAWVGGVVSGMLILVLGLALFGGSPASTKSLGDPAAAWDTSATLTDAYLTAQARKNGAGQVQEPTLRVQGDGLIALTGKFSLLGRTVPVNATLRPGVADGKLEMPIEKVNLGGLPLPNALINQFANGVMGATQPPANALPTTIVRLETADGKLTIYSKMK